MEGLHRGAAAVLLALAGAGASACDRTTTVDGPGFQLTVPAGYVHEETIWREPPLVFVREKTSSPVGTKFYVYRRALEDMRAIDDASCRALWKRADDEEAKPDPGHELPQALRTILGVDGHRNTVHEPYVRSYSFGTACHLEVGLRDIDSVPWDLNVIVIDDDALWHLTCSGDGSALRKKCSQLLDGFRFVAQ